MGQEIFTEGAEGLTGEKTFDVSGSYKSVTKPGQGADINYAALRNWQIQFVVSGAPTAGTAAISVKSPGATGFSGLSTSVDLANGPLLATFEAVADEIKVTPSGFDGDSFDVVLTAS